MTHDPLQTLAMLGAYSGVPTLQPFTGQQNYGQLTGLNPFAAQQQQLSPFNTPNLPINPGSFQGGLQSPFGQNPFGGFQQNPLAVLQNPLIAALQNPMIHPLVAQAIGAQLGLQQQLQQQLPYQAGGYGISPFQQTGFQQPGLPYGQTGYPLAPQSWVGQTGHAGQIHPLYQQLAARAFATPGINPWVGY
jgi:hypothetical protein